MGEKDDESGPGEGEQQPIKEATAEDVAEAIENAEEREHKQIIIGS